MKYFIQAIILENFDSKVLVTSNTISQKVQLGWIFIIFVLAGH